jgi:SAM-dependent methyltransferase
MSTKKQLKNAYNCLSKLPGFKILEKCYDLLTGASSEHWSRVVMGDKQTKYLCALPLNQLKALEISGDHWKDLPFQDYKDLHYPDFDICEQVLPEKFDVIIAEQVFEHLLYPYRAGKNIYEMLSPGGLFLISTPFLLRVHGAPTDCTRWTETGLKYFLNECGFSIDKIETDSWGNRACVKANFLRWTTFRKRIHSLSNEPEFPFHVWAFARK